MRALVAEDTSHKRRFTSLMFVNHPKSVQNSEKNNYYQRVLTEELLRAFSFGHLLRQSSE